MKDVISYYEEGGNSNTPADVGDEMKTQAKEWMKLLDTCFNMSSENVNNPQHYNQGSIECCDAMVSAFGSELFSQFCVMNAMKYLWRSNHHKDGRDRNI